MLPQEIIRTKRDGAALSGAQIEQFVAGVTAGSVTEGQIAAFCMAVFFRGMDPAERSALTLAMARSGTLLDWSAEGLNGPVLDKHSTGGVGDKVSLILAPLIAACGGFVPMISGRGLGHTGGTLDKMDSIPGYVSRPDRATLRRVVGEAGCAILGATDDIAPADRRLYAIRDVTATIESVDLITASILSKKLAAGLDGLVLDVKFGSGAFCPRLAQAESLARSLIATATPAGLPAVALLTDMNQVLGRAAGNAVEVHEAIAVLTGREREPRLLQVTLALAAEMLRLGGLAETALEAWARARLALDSGAAAERFARMVKSLGGPADLVESPERHLPAAPVRRPVFAATGGMVTAIDVRRVGLAIVELGGGRRAPADAIDPAVGLTAVAGPGEPAGPDAAPLAVIHARSETDADRAEAALRDAFVIGDRAPAAGPLIPGSIAPEL